MNKEFVFYIIFAIISTFLNFLIQITVDKIFLILNNPFFLNYFYNNINLSFIIKILSATIGAFVFKYLVDKIIIFKVNKEISSNSNFIMILLYTFFAVFTTLIFWSTQFVFRIFTDYEYFGMIAGLGIGYSIKFVLDKNFVFVKKNVI